MVLRLKKEIKTTIDGCARCGDKHVDLEFKLFVKNSIMDANGTHWNYWAMCPNIKEPILLKIIEVS